ncbi:uncharacterized protein EV420DRAFT_451725 [Desarmillaria tabescens]|uniref:Uncharacterized protein n=2 Tax=Physalacriaceae TaxID=862241 RepID=A0AA39NM60_ARMTA|nr:uncharacterized protein EV420DRAFT_451725 [Desarmillaria tabescens]KAK0468202.1 hypothetical protein EV420DRAFT_451725 [Desarmillaria tabescens]
MFSSAGTSVSSMSASRSRQSGASPVKASKGFSVNIFKAPTLSSFQSSGTIKFNRSSSFQNPGFQQGQQNWLSSWSWFNSTSNPSNPSGKASSLPVGGEAQPSRQTTTSSFYIYPSTSTNGTYIYQPSINSAKSEIYSNSDYDASTASLATASSDLSSSLSTDTVLTSPSSQNVPLPLPAPAPALSKALSSSAVQFGAASDRRSSQTGADVRLVPVSREASDQRPAFQGYSTTSSYQAAYEDASSSPLPTESDDEEFNRISRRNTEYNSRTSYPQAFRPVSSHPSVQMTQSEIITTDNADSHRASSQAASFPAGISRSIRTLGAATLPQRDVPGPSRQRSIPLPPTPDDPPSQSTIASAPVPYNAAFRRNTAFMPYYFPDAVVSDDPEQQKTSPQNSMELPRPAVPPGLAHPEMAGRQTPNPETSSNPQSRNGRISTPDPHEGSSDDDLSGIPILSYNETVSPPAAHATGMDVPRTGRATYSSQKVEVQEQKRTYAAVAASAKSESSVTTSFPRPESPDISPSSQSPPYNLQSTSPLHTGAGTQRASSIRAAETTSLPSHPSTSVPVPNMALPPTMAPGTASQSSAPRISTNDINTVPHEQRRSPREETARMASRTEGSVRPSQDSLAQRGRASVAPDLPRTSNDRRSSSETRHPAQGSVHTEQVSQMSIEPKNGSAGMSSAVARSSHHTSWQIDRDRSRQGSVSLAPPIQSANEMPVAIQVTSSRTEAERSRPRRDSFSHHATSREMSPHQSIPTVVPSKTPNMPSRSISPSLDPQRSSRSRNDALGSSYPPSGRVPSPTKDTSPTQRSLPKPPRRYSEGEDSALVPSSSGPSRDRKDSGTSVFRRRSDGDQVPPHSTFNPIRLTSNAGAARSVRWNQNLICPSPIWPEQRRKGWFNRRGDQLWTNTGTYKTPEPGDEFPLDLDGYPEPGQGWMNEDGVRIDMMHRLVPKAPLRSALKPNPRSQLSQSAMSL